MKALLAARVFDGGGFAGPSAVLFEHGQVIGLTGAAELMFARSLVGAGSKVLIAATAATAARDDDLVIRMLEVVNQFAGVVIVEQSSDRNLQHSVFARGAGHVAAQTMATALGLPLWVEPEVDQRVVRERRAHEDVAAVAAVAAGGSPAGNELLAPEGHAAVAAIAGLDANARLIDEHKRLKLKSTARRQRLKVAQILVRN